MAGSAASCQLSVNTACSSVCRASEGDYRMIYCSVYTVDPCSFSLCPGILYVANCCVHQLNILWHMSKMHFETEGDFIFKQGLSVLDEKVQIP